MLAHEMRVHVHETRHHGMRFQVDDRVAVATRHETIQHLSDFAVFDHDGDFDSNFITASVDQTSCVDDGGCLSATCNQATKSQKKATHAGSLSSRSVAPS